MEIVADRCIDTHAFMADVPCEHGQWWWCARVPHRFWFPLAPEPKWRSLEYVQTQGANRTLLTGYPDARRGEKLKAVRAKGVTWAEIFERIDEGRT